MKLLKTLFFSKRSKNQLLSDQLNGKRKIIKSLSTRVRVQKVTNEKQQRRLMEDDYQGRSIKKCHCEDKDIRPLVDEEPNSGLYCLNCSKIINFKDIHIA
ncbi:hypothetical protein [Guptibacillus spartinae]|uniref:hypothetical protein n=1 Tax=Guptibacillus spartinae TaxID=3025679 RepID=UPI002361D1AB|nr:hypothetical protein [Pseudalkalibacillus spartinae]